MKNINALGLLDEHFLLEKLTKLGYPLAKLAKYIDWKVFEIPQWRKHYRSGACDGLLLLPSRISPHSAGALERKTQ